MGGWKNNYIPDKSRGAGLGKVTVIVNNSAYPY
jgi:hypothetical protein